MEARKSAFRSNETLLAYLLLVAGMSFSIRFFAVDLSVTWLVALGCCVFAGLLLTTWNRSNFRAYIDQTRESKRWIVPERSNAKWWQYRDDRQNRQLAFWQHYSTKQILLCLTLIGGVFGYLGIVQGVELIQTARDVGRIGRVYGREAEIVFDLLYGSLSVLYGLQSLISLLPAERD